MCLFLTIGAANKNMKEKILQIIIFIILLDFLMFYQIFFSPQVKQCTIITYKHGMCEILYELLNDLRLRILGNRKFQESV